MNLVYKNFLLSKIRFFSPDYVDKLYGVDKNEKKEKNELTEEDREKIIKDYEKRQLVLEDIKKREISARGVENPDDWLEKALNDEENNVIKSEKNIDKSSINSGNADINIGN